MKSKIIKTLIFVGLVITSITTITLVSVNAKSVYDEYSLDQQIQLTDEYEYTVLEMLNYAIMDEYLAQAEYEAILNEFGDVMPFSRIVNAEVNHINLLIDIFETYGYDIPKNDVQEYIVIPDSITSALSTGIDAEEANIAMYQVFLAQDNLPDDIREAFEYLLNASENHLKAFSNDHYSYYGTDLANKIKNQFQKAFKYQYRGNNGNQQGDATCNN